MLVGRQNESVGRRDSTTLRTTALNYMLIGEDCLISNTEISKMGISWKWEWRVSRREATGISKLISKTGVSKNVLGTKNVLETDRVTINWIKSSL